MKIFKYVGYYILFLAVITSIAMGIIFAKDKFNRTKHPQSDTEIEKDCMVYAQVAKNELWNIECEKAGLDDKCELPGEKHYELEKLYEERFNFCLVKQLEEIQN